MMSLFYNINSNIHSQRGRWERGRSPIGRVALIPISVCVTHKFYRSTETLYANVFCLYGLFLYACLCRDEGNPTYGFLSLSARFYVMRILFNGALANSTLRKYDNLTYFSRKLFFNVKITLCKKWSKR